MPMDKNKLATFAKPPPPAAAATPTPVAAPGAEPNAEADASQGDAQVAQEVIQRASEGQVNTDIEALVADLDIGQFLEQPPPFATDAELWQRALMCSDPDAIEAAGLSLPSIVAHVYVALGGEIQGLETAADGQEGLDGAENPVAKPAPPPPKVPPKPPAA